jgi:hypothetical protein|tara:strand:+ start:5092 stop:5730 length:639 start_codon:yes stop_codon:yes gene_type:complete
MQFNKTVKLEADYPFSDSQTLVKNFSVSDITTVTFDINGVAKYEGADYSLGILKTIAYYGDNIIEFIPSQLNTTTLGFEPVSSFDHTYHVATEDNKLLGKVEFLYKNGNTTTIFLSVFTSQSNNIDLELYTANNQSFFSNGEVRELINFTNYENNLYSMAYTPTPLYKYDDRTGDIEFFTLSGFEGNFLTTENDIPILLKGFSYNDQRISVT